MAPPFRGCAAVALVAASCWLLSVIAAAQAGESAAGHGEQGLTWHQAWQEAHDLTPFSSLPPLSLVLPPGVPPAPHLEECTARTVARGRAEGRGEGGEAPAWTSPSSCCGCSPQPPWIRGDDASNLPLTRVAQTHIWLHQFPASCDGRRLLIADWPQLNADVAAEGEGAAKEGAGAGGGLEGMGATGSMGGKEGMDGMAWEVHVVGGLLGVAMRVNRTLVITPDSFPHANHSACSATPASLACFFSPLTTSSCQQAAADAAPLEATPSFACANAAPATASATASAAASQLPSQRLDELEALLTSAAPVVRVCTGGLGRDQLLLLANESRVATQWGPAVSQAARTVEVAGVVRPHDEQREQLHWWRSQAVRFLFRWPSAHLCHVTNLIRHVSYGRDIAAQMHSAAQQQAAIIRMLSAGPSEADKSIGIDTAAEAKFLASVDIRAGPSLEGQVWPALGFEGCVKVKEGGQGGSVILDEVYEAVGREVYIIRPIVSVHVSGSGSGSGSVGEAGKGVADGAGDSTVASVAGSDATSASTSTTAAFLPAFMFLSHRLRRHEPHLRHVWLTSSGPDVANELSEYPDWTFHSARQGSTKEQLFPSGLEGAPGSAMGPMASMLSHLLIASESDYFVGTLSSPSAMLLNELRSTNGRLHSGFISFN